jgi:hypothetical protein
MFRYAAVKWTRDVEFERLALLFRNRKLYAKNVDPETVYCS